MFAPSYSSEGTMIESNTKLRKVTRFSSPDDDPQAMLLLCLLIYHRLPQDDSPSFDILVGLAMLVHKYDLRDLVRFYSQVWMMPGLAAAASKNEAVLVVAYMLENEIVFERVTRKLILNFTCDFKETFDRDLGFDIIPPEDVFRKYLAVLELL
jgi:hypothetical protein